jgi:signal transduction histidine kinase
VGPVRLHDAEGEGVDCEISSSTLRLDGADTRLVIAEDVTQHLRTQRMVQRADRMDSLGHLAGGMAHDFNNALAVILSYAEFAEEELTRAAAEDPARWESVRSDVHGIGVAGQRAAGLTRQLLSFARGEPAASSSIDLNAVVRDLSDMLERTLGERIDLRLALAPDLRPLRGDPSHLEQIIVNLAVNARDAMPDGGVLSISTSAVEVDEHNTTARPDLRPGPHVRLRVSDTGTGMDPATQELALEPFFTTKPRGAGTGLGLATIYGIITRMGGSIHIYSEVDLGTSVSVMFPAGSADDVAITAAAPDTSSRGQGETVLVIDDDDDIRSVAERILVRAGFEVITATDGDDALALAADRPGEIDLVLTDIVMPRMLGTELARRLRLQQPGIRVLFMSGYAPPVAVDPDALEDDMIVLDKPFSAASLVEKVAETLARAHLP